MITSETLMEAARGIPTGVAVRVLGWYTPGVDWRGCGKRYAFDRVLPAGSLSSSLSRWERPRLTQKAAAACVAYLKRIRARMAEGYGAGVAADMIREGR